MLSLTNAFILFLLVAAAWIGVAALVQKRSVRGGHDDVVSPAVASERID